MDGKAVTYEFGSKAADAIPTTKKEINAAVEQANSKLGDNCEIVFEEGGKLGQPETYKLGSGKNGETLQNLKNELAAKEAEAAGKPNPAQSIKEPKSVVKDINGCVFTKKDFKYLRDNGITREEIDYLISNGMKKDEINALREFRFDEKGLRDWFQLKPNGKTPQLEETAVLSSNTTNPFIDGAELSKNPIAEDAILGSKNFTNPPKNTDVVQKNVNIDKKLPKKSNDFHIQGEDPGVNPYEIKNPFTPNQGLKESSTAKNPAPDFKVPEDEIRVRPDGTIEAIVEHDPIKNITTHTFYDENEKIKNTVVSHYRNEPAFHVPAGKPESVPGNKAKNPIEPKNNIPDGASAKESLPKAETPDKKIPGNELPPQKTSNASIDEHGNKVEKEFTNGKLSMEKTYSPDGTLVIKYDTDGEILTTIFNHPKGRTTVDTRIAPGRYKSVDHYPDGRTIDNGKYTKRKKQ